MPKTKNKQMPDIRELVRTYEKLTDTMHDGNEQIPTDPAQALATLAEALDNWKDADKDPLILSDSKYQEFRRNIARQLNVDIYLVMKDSVRLLYQKQQEAGKFMEPTDLAAIVSMLGKMVTILDKVEGVVTKGSDRPPVDEINKELEELQKEFATDSGTRPDILHS